MSASEKLKRIGDPESTDSPAAKLGAALLLQDALPQIVAVVEAAEHLHAMQREPWTNEYGWLTAALTALDSALGGGVT